MSEVADDNKVGFLLIDPFFEILDIGTQNMLMTTLLGYDEAFGIFHGHDGMDAQDLADHGASTWDPPASNQILEVFHGA